MANKNKNESKKSVATSKKKTEKKNTSSNAKIYLLVLPSAAVLILSLILYKIYDNLSYVPPLPELDLNAYWGPEVRLNSDTTIRRYKPLFTDAMKEDLRQRFANYRSRPTTPSLEGSACQYGFSSKAVSDVFQYWQFEYKIDERQKYLNKYDHYKTNVQGLDVHFVRVKPKVDENVKILPILLLHGWPSSFRDFFDVIPVLTNPQAGYSFVFEVIVPSLPGFIYSDASSKPGFAPAQAAIVMRNLMHRLGFKQFYIQGGDFGHVIGSHIATLFPNEVLGLHSNFLANFSPKASLNWILGSFYPSLVVEKEFEERMYPLKPKFEYYIEESGYMHIQGSKPDSVGVGLNDSPIGLAAYLLDKYLVFSNPSNRNLTECGLSKYNIGDFMDNVMLYWSSQSIITAMRMYKESYQGYELENILARIPTKVPTWSLSARHELIHQPDWILKFKYLNLLGITYTDEGGHFFAIEKPIDLANDVFKAVKLFVEFNKNKQI